MRWFRRPRERPAVPETVRSFSRVVATLGALVLVAVTVLNGGLPTTGLPATTASLALVATLAVLAPLRFQHGRGTQGFTLDEGVLVAMLFVLPGPVPALVMTAATLLAHALLRAQPVKIAFNTGQMALAASAGLVAFRVVGPSLTVLSARSIGVALLAALIHNVVSSLSLAELFRRLDSRTVAETLRAVWRLNAMTLLGNTSFGLVLAVVAAVDPAATVLASTLLVGLHLGYRGYVGQLEERRRTDALHHFTRALLESTSDLGPPEELFDQVLGTLGGNRADLLLVSPAAGVTILRFEHAPGTADDAVRDAASRRILGEVMGRRRPFRISPTDATAELLDGLEESDAIAVPVTHRAQDAGALVVYGRRGLEPWTDTHVTLLATMAAELAVALRNVELFKQVERERSRLESETAKLTDILGAASDGIVLVRGDGTVESWNPGMERITGVQARDAIGLPWAVVLRLRTASGVELLPSGRHLFTDAMAGSRSEAPVVLQALRHDGTWRWLQCTTAPTDTTAGVTGVVLVARDVTGEREVEDLKADFIATVSHELRTPLTPLKGFLSTIQQRADTLRPEQLRAVHEAMTTQVSRLETLIADLLAVAELEHGRFEVRPEPVDLAHLVAAAVEVECDAQGEARGASRRCQVVVARPVAAMADTVALVRVVRALVSNALKHTAGAVEVVVDAEGDSARVEVRDHGPGISVHDQPRIFERFGRLGDHLRRTQGPGLGLTIARALAGRMGGEIRLESDVETGSRFTLTLPRARTRALPVEIDTPAATRSATAAG